MSDVAVECMVCKQTVEVPANYVDKNWRCPQCQTRFVPARGDDGQLAAKAIDGEPQVAQADDAASPSRIRLPATFGLGALGVSFAVGIALGVAIGKLVL